MRLNGFFEPLWADIPPADLDRKDWEAHPQAGVSHDGRSWQADQASVNSSLPKRLFSESLIPSSQQHLETGQVSETRLSSLGCQSIRSLCAKTWW
jgi:hypothetical protein